MPNPILKEAVERYFLGGAVEGESATGLLRSKHGVNVCRSTKVVGVERQI
jgi:hypothetical protein